MSLRKMLVLLVLFLTSCAPVTPPVPVTPPAPPSSVPPTVVVTDTPATGDAQYLPRFETGALNPAVSQTTIQSTICVSGYSSSIRPPLSYTEPIKIAKIKQYGYSDTNTADYELDHLIPLSVGGDPRDPNNLWPQPRNTPVYNAGVKDQLEYKMYQMVCAGQVSLADAQAAFIPDWVEGYRKFMALNPSISLTPEP